MHKSVRFYVNGEYKVQMLSADELHSHIEYNKIMRKDMIVFIDNQYICGGNHLSPEKFKELREKFAERVKHIQAS